MMTGIRAAGLIVIQIFAIVCMAGAGDLDRTSITFSRDVAPIFQNHCQSCHRPGEAAPMALLNYEQARPWAKSIRQKVSARQMPPWHADPAIGEWKNDRRLSDKELQTVVAWVDGGTIEGNPADLPPAKEWTDGWQIGKPDMVFTVLTEQTLPPDLVDQYRMLIIPTKLKEDTWIEAMEVRPGNRAVVHHVNVFESSSLNTPELRAQLAEAVEKNKTPEGKTRQMSGTGFGPNGEPPGRVGGFLPGGLPLMLPDGQGILLPANCSLLLQVHYHKEPGAEARDRTSVGVRFLRQPPTQKLFGGAVDNCHFKIPAGATDHEVVAELTLEDDVRVTAMSPHMHLRGKDFTVWADLPNGQKLDILSVPHYDFNWQTTYEPAKPISLPKGTKLKTRAHYDNSRGNPFNPNPDIDIEWGEPTTDEMMLMFFRYTRDRDPMGA